MHEEPGQAVVSTYMDTHVQGDDNGGNYSSSEEGTCWSVYVNLLVSAPGIPV